MSNKVRNIKREIDKRNAAAPGAIIVKLEDLIKSNGELRSLLMQSVPAKTAFALSKVAKAVDAELTAFQAARTGACKRLASKDADGTAIVIPAALAEDKQTVLEPEHYDISAEAMETLNRELAELLQTEVSLSVNTIKIDALSSVNIPAAHLVALSWLVVE